MKRHSPTLMLALGLYTAQACVPEVEDADTLVSGPRVLAIRSEPAELEPRRNGTYTALFVDEDGTQSEAPLEWSFCSARKPLAELGPVSSLCLLDDPEAARALEPDGGNDRDPILEELGQGIETEGRMPATACRYFGPDRPPPMEGQPAGRPVDPDPTGGYYQPLRIFNRDDGAVSLYEARITCGLPGAGREATVEYNQRFTPNDNPVIDGLVVTSDGDRPLAPAAQREPLRVRPGEVLSLELRWAQCEPLEPCDAADDEVTCEPPPACDGAQAYVYYDPETRRVSGRREGMRVSWFSTAGTFRDARTGRTEQEADTSYSANLWTAPAREGRVTLWVVLRDDRGGVSWQTYAVFVER
jgi:hypothetical protein